MGISRFTAASLLTVSAIAPLAQSAQALPDSTCSAVSFASTIEQSKSRDAQLLESLQLSLERAIDPEV